MSTRCQHCNRRLRRPHSPGLCGRCQGNRRCRVCRDPSATGRCPACAAALYYHTRVTTNHGVAAHDPEREARIAHYTRQAEQELPLTLSGVSQWSSRFTTD